MLDSILESPPPPATNATFHLGSTDAARSPTFDHLTAGELENIRHKQLRTLVARRGQE